MTSSLSPENKNLQSMLALLRTECNAKDVEIADLKAKLAACTSATAPQVNSSVIRNNDPFAIYKQMLKKGVPRPAVEQKMRMAGLDPSILNAPVGSVAVSSATPSRPAMGGPMAGLLAGLGAAKLKKTNLPIENPVTTEKPKNSKQSAAASLAEEAKRKAEERALRSSMTVEERLAAAKAAKEAASASQPKTGFAAFANELKKTARKTSTESASQPVPQYHFYYENLEGPLPSGWKLVNDGQNRWYVKSNGTSPQWERPTQGGKPKNRRNTRKNRRTQRRRRSS